MKILFVCHGTICRSPMAEFVMRDMLEKAGLSARISVASAATSAEELGNPVYPPVRRLLSSHGISCAGKTARGITQDDFYDYDLLIGMDNMNLRNMRRVCPAGMEHKLKLLLDYTDRPGEVADPWYSGDFEATWRDVNDGCRGLLAEL